MRDTMSATRGRHGSGGFAIRQQRMILTQGNCPLVRADEITAHSPRHYGSLPTTLRLVVTLLLMVTLGVGTTWGQTVSSGLYYIASGGNNGTVNQLVYNSESPTTNFYLCPTENWRYFKSESPYYQESPDNGMPFMTTYQCRDGEYDSKNALWCIKKKEDTDYYYIIHLLDGKYLTRNTKIQHSCNAGRMRVHLESSPADDDDALFTITYVNQFDCYDIKTKKSDGTSGDDAKRQYLNVSGGNKNSIEGTTGKNDGPKINGTGAQINVGGIIGLWTYGAYYAEDTSKNDQNSRWNPESTLLTAPTISEVSTLTGKVTVTDNNDLPSGYNVRYTFSSSGTPADPTASSDIMPSDGLFITDTGILKVVIERYGVVLTEVEQKSVAPTLCATPVISFDYATSMASISCATASTTIYYTTDGSTPSTSSTLYNGSFSVNSSTTIKAIATRTSLVNSEVATLTITQVATPIIQNNGSNAISITCATEGATIYYTTDGSDPTTSSTEYTGPLTENVSNVTIKAIAVKENMITSAVGSGTVTLQCATPVITRDGMTFTLSCSMPTDATFYYSLDGNTPATLYNGAVSFTSDQLPMTVTAVARHNDYTDSEYATFELLNGTGTSSDPYLIYGATDFANFVANVNNGTTASKCYKLETDVSGSGVDAITTAFTGTFDGDMHTISNLGHALFNTVNDGTVKNVILDNVKISGGTNVGAICNEATGDSRIYNCGVLATNSTVTKDEDGYTDITFTSRSSTISGSGYVGGIVGLLDGSSRVINCFSYANVSGGSHVGGIVGYNNVETTSSNLKTMVMNCMFYGDITSGTSKAPIYNGKSIVNKDASGVSNFNYFLLEAPYMDDRNTTKTYNCALAAEKRYLQRFEYFRHLLNSHRELAGWWATGTYSSSEMAKWVLEPSQIGTSTCYPILKTPGYYPSVVNLDAENATIQTERNKGGKLGTLSVTIQMGSGGAQFTPPTGASITTSSLTLNITDKDPDHFNFNYYKVQLPFYNDVGTKNYTSNLVVTGWKIVDITGGTTGSYTTGEDASADANGNITATPYNFADRKCTNKDLYSVSGRVFNQGAYWDVPDGVTAITIQPYWAKAAYFADAYADVVYDESMGTSYNVPNVGGGQIYTNGNNYNIAGEQQKVYTSIDNAKDAIGEHSGHTVYDYAVVLVGNAHNIGVSSDKTTHFYTIMSADFDHDNEPDYTYILRFNNRNKVHPVRLDFVNIPGLGMAQKSTGGTGTYNFGIAQPLSWFESTNTSLFRVTQFEYDNSSRIEAPYILQGGIIEQWVSGQDGGAANKTIYYHVGGNVWFNEFHRGTHQDKTLQSKHPPVSVTGGDYDQFYLTGLYKAVTAYNDDAECYINGGRFGIVAGTGLEGIGDAGNHTKGNIIWQIQNADINEFYGGGINAASPSQGNITTVITGGYIKQFCGGPKFGDMQSGRTVKTTATDCTFDTYFGAGYGGNSYSRQTPYNYNNKININWNKWVKGEQKAHADSKYHGYIQEYRNETDASYEGGIFEGVSTQIAYQFIPMSGNADNCARLWIEYVKFSLATTHSVTSNLTGCTITGNFYGGGSLGKVDGPVNSTLTNCTVNGNVFGAGFSASLPVVKVMNTGGFTEEPYYDQDLGIYLPATFPGTVDYTWKHADTVNSTATAIKTTETEHFLYTEVDISTSNLGSVQGNVILTIQTEGGKTTTIGTAGNPNTGNVFGGGEQSYVTNSTDPVTIHDVTVNLKGPGTTNILGNVFGGGDQGTVEGNTKVKIMVPEE